MKANNKHMDDNSRNNGDQGINTGLHHKDSTHVGASVPKLKRFNPFKSGLSLKSPGVLVFIIFFALVGSYLILKSFAAITLPTSARIVAGSSTGYTDTKGNVWTPDADFVGGKQYTTTDSIGGTTDQFLFKHEHASMTDYNVPLANGNYTLNLYMAEIWTPNCVVNARTFNVSAGTQTLLKNFDIFAKVGCEKADIESFPVTVTNGVLNIHFTAGTTSATDPNPKVDAIEVIPTSTTVDTTPPSVPAGLTATASSSSQIKLTWAASTDNAGGSGVSGYKIYRGTSQIGAANGANATSFTDTGLTASTAYSYTVSACDSASPPNCSVQSTSVSATTLAAITLPTSARIVAGSSTGYTDTKGNVWTPDADFVGGKQYTTTDSIGGTTDQFLFKHEHASMTDYNVPLANGNYTLNLYMAEIWTPNCVVNARTFNVSAGTQTLLKNFDIFAKVGCEKADIESFPVTVTNGVLNIHFTAGTTSATDPNPKVDAIEVIPTSTTVDTTPPSVPAGLTATASSSSQIKLTWAASTDNAGGSGVSGYKIYRGTSQIGAANGANATSFTDTGLTASTAYSYTVSACDSASPPNCSVQSTSVSATTLAATDTQAPNVPTGLTTTPLSSSQIKITWTASTDNPNPGGSGVAGYTVFRNGSPLNTSLLTSTSFTDTGLAASTTYSYTVLACDAATPPNCSSQSAAVGGKTQASPDTTDPTAPSNLTATAASATKVNLAWTASSDPDSPALTYTITRNGTPLGTTTSTTYSDTTVVGNTSYSYQVQATDPSLNPSPLSNIATVTTPKPPDTTAPSIPTGLVATTPSSTQVNLTWNASTDNPGGSGLAGYNVYRNGTKIATSTTTNFGDATVSAGATYSYAVSAFDAVGNTSNQSTTVSVTTSGGVTNSNCTTTILSPANVGTAESGMSPGGVLCLHGGVYNQQFSLSKAGTSSAPITVQSYPGETAIIDGTGFSIGKTGQVINVAAPYIILSGLEMRISSGRFITVSASNDIIQNSIFHDIQYNAIVVGTGANNVLVQNNEAYNTVLSNTNDVIGTSGWAEAFNTFQSTNTTFRNNYIHNNWGEGIDFIGSTGGLADGNRVENNYSVEIYVDGTGGVTITNNHLGGSLGNRNTSGVLLGDEGNTGNVKNIVINNNLFYGVGIGYWGIVTRSAYTASGNQMCTTITYATCSPYNP